MKNQDTKESVKFFAGKVKKPQNYVRQKNLSEAV